MPPNYPQTLLPLETFRDELGHNPFHWWQLAGPLMPLTASCSTLLREYSWQSVDAAGRSEIRKAIAEAEKNLRNYLGFDVATRYWEETMDVGYLKMLGGNDIDYPVGYYWPTGYNGALSPRTWILSPALATCQAGSLTRIATRTWTPISEQAVNYYDYDGDGLNDTFEVQIADASTDLADFGLFFADADRVKNAQNLPVEAWQVRPVTFSRSGGVVTATGPSWMLVIPKKYEGVGNPVGVNITGTGMSSSGSYDPANSSNFVSNLAFYKKVYTKENTAYWIFDDCGTLTTLEICATIADASTGQVRLDFSCCPQAVSPSNYSATQRIQINYEAGQEIKDWQTIVTRYALAELRKRICACEQNNAEVQRWQRDLAQVAANGGTDGYRIDDETLGNPLGTRAGAVYAWNQIKNLRKLSAVNLI